MIRAVAAVAMITPAWPAFRAVASGALRRAAPHLAVRLSAGLAAGTLVAIAIAALAPVPLVLAGAAVGLAITAVEAWRARPGRGVRDGLPPGSFGLLPLGHWRDQAFYAKQQARYGSVFKARQIVRPMVCIADLPTGRALLKEEDEALVAPPLSFSSLIPGGYVRYRAPAEHAHYKEIFRIAFSRDVVRARAETLREGFRDGLAAVAAEGPSGVPPRARVNRLLFPLWVGLFTGLEPGAPEAARLKELARVLDIRNPSWASQRRRQAAAEEASAIMRLQGERLAPGSPGEVPSCFLGEIGRHEAEALEDPAVLGNLAFLLMVTWADVGGLLTWITRMLADHPTVAAAARAETTAGGTEPDARDALCSRIVLETLRLEQSEHLYRRTNRPVVIGDRTIPTGWTVRICTHEAHRDPRTFDRPDAFDPDRFLERSYAKDQFSPFGSYRLACLGEQVTLTVARIFTEELVAGYDLVTTHDAPPELGSWGHWVPGRDWRLALIPVARRAA